VIVIKIVCLAFFIFLAASFEILHESAQKFQHDLSIHMQFFKMISIEQSDQECHEIFGHVEVMGLFL